MNPTVTAEQAGTYRQLAHKLRIQGRVPETSERPRHQKSRRFLDDKEPTLIAFAEGDPADVARLLAIGAIEPWAAPAPASAEPEPASEPEKPKRGGARGQAAE